MLRIRLWDDWYNVTYEQLKATIGGGLPNKYYHGSLYLLLQAVYPERLWLPWKFHRVPKGFWDSRANQRDTVQYLSQQLGIEHWEQWYTVVEHQIRALRCGGLLQQYYNNSLAIMLQTLLPEFPWVTQNFHHTLKEYRTAAAVASNEESQRGHTSHSAPPTSSAAQHVVTQPVSNHSSLTTTASISIGERLLRRAVQQLLPNHSPTFNRPATATKAPQTSDNSLETIPDDDHSLLLRHSSGRAMEFDVFYESLRLAFEYQGQQHYPGRGFGTGGTGTTRGSEEEGSRTTWQQQVRRDNEKREACKRAGITLIEVPYWWDGTLQALATAIAYYRPDISLNLTNPLPSVTGAVATPPTFLAAGLASRLKNVSHVMHHLRGVNGDTSVTANESSSSQSERYFTSFTKYHDWMNPTHW